MTDAAGMDGAGSAVSAAGSTDGARYPATKRNTPSRHDERARYDAVTVHGILDAGLVAHVGFVADELPHVLPMLYVRDGDSLYLHGSTGAHIARMAARRSGLPIAVEVTLIDALVLARSTFSHSVNYRSVVAHGEGTIVQEPERKDEILARLVERLIPGRTADARSPRPDELRKTAVLELRLSECDVAAKVRSGGPLDDEGDLGSDCWAGVWPLSASFGEPVAADGLRAGIALPSYLGPKRAGHAGI